MRYLALVYAAEHDPAASGYRLAEAGSTTTLRVQGGRPVLGDGPYAVTDLPLRRVCVLEADDLDRALELAAELAPDATVELRPVDSAEGRSF